MIAQNLLISSPGEYGGLFLLHGSTVARLLSRPTTGIGCSKERMIVAFQDDGGKSVKFFRNGFVEDRNLLDSPMDLHDLVYHDDNLYATDTENNRVIEFDAKWQIVNQWSLAGEPDSVHLNSVAFYRNHLLASVFGRFQRTREYKEGTSGYGEIIDIWTGKTYIDSLSQPHSLRVIDDLLYVCNSEHQELRIYDGNILQRKIPVSGYARGLTVCGEKVLVGLSISRNVVQNQAPQSESARIVILDRNTLQIEDSISIPAPEVFDLACSALEAWMLPYLLQEMTSNSLKQNEIIAQYKRGYDCFKQKSAQQDKMLNTLIGERDEQITTLNASIAERDEQITTLNASVAERDEQITTLNTSAAERDEQITTLNTSVAERDEQITTLNTSVAERDEQITTLNTSVAERDEQITKQDNQIVKLISMLELIKSSKSWRITAPLRYIYASLFRK